MRIPTFQETIFVPSSVLSMFIICLFNAMFSSVGMLPNELLQSRHVDRQVCIVNLFRVG